jgi:hypothetical protein
LAVYECNTLSVTDALRGTWIWTRFMYMDKTKMNNSETLSFKVVLFCSC